MMSTATEITGADSREEEFVLSGHVINCAACGGEVELLESEVRDAVKLALSSNPEFPTEDGRGDFLVSPPFPTDAELAESVGTGFEPTVCACCKTLYHLRYIVRQIKQTGVCQHCERYIKGETNHIHVEAKNFVKFERLRERRDAGELLKAEGYCARCFLDNYLCADCDGARSMKAGRAAERGED